jgi:ATP-dependent Zn protease
MVNKRVYNYLVKHSKQHSLTELTKRLVDSGYDRNVVIEAVNEMKKQTQTKPSQRSNLSGTSTQKTNAKAVAVKNLPVKKIVKKSTPVVAKTKTQVAPQKQVKQSSQVKPTKVKEIVKPKKSKKWLWISLIILLLLIGAGAVYYFFFRS